MTARDYVGSPDGLQFDMYVRGTIPPAIEGTLIVAASRRSKDRGRFARWHDSQADLIRLDLKPGSPGRVQARVLPVDTTGADCAGHALLDRDRRMFADPLYGYATQPNHGINVAGSSVWATNLIFGAPLEVDLDTWRPRQVLRYLDLTPASPRVTGTAHFATSLDGRYVYLQQSLLEPESGNRPVRACDLTLIELDVVTGSERSWLLKPPPDDAAMESANFHSAFYFEEQGKRYVGLLRTGALLEHLAPHTQPVDHAVVPASPSTIWIVELDRLREVLQAQLLPGIGELDGLALSHLDVDASSGDGFVLYANFKEADVGEETHGMNVYGERPEEVAEHYSGMIVEALNVGLVFRYERRDGRSTIKTFRRGYDPAKTSLGHTWLPINIQLDRSRTRLFCSFSGFRPRLLPKHVADAYPARVADVSRIRPVPSALMRLDAATLEPHHADGHAHLSYSEPVAFAVAGEGDQTYVCTFSPEVGLRIYHADDLNRMVCRAESPHLVHWRDNHFRPEPAHMVFVNR